MLNGHYGHNLDFNGRDFVILRVDLRPDAIHISSQR